MVSFGGGTAWGGHCIELGAQSDQVLLRQQLRQQPQLAVAAAAGRHAVRNIERAACSLFERDARAVRVREFSQFGGELLHRLMVAFAL